MATIKDLAEQYGVAKAQDQNENLGRLAEMLGSARDIGNEYKVPSWVPLAGGTGAGDLLMGAAPEEIENWSYGNAPMQIPEMSNVPQFKRGRAQSLADALTTLAPGVKATEGLPAGLSFIGPKSRNWDKVAVELAAKKLDEGADPLSKYKDYVGEHSAPLGDSGAPLHNLTANENAIYPSDVYSSQANQYYGSGEPEDAQLFAMAQRLKDKPNEKVSIYRAVPKMQSNSEKAAQLEKDLANYMKRGRMPSNSDFNNKSDWYEWASNERDRLASLPEETLDPLSINHGDWVALDKKYAKEHGESALGGNYKILSKKVPARQLFTNGDSIREWGWDSRYAEGGEVDIRDDEGYADKASSYLDDLAQLKEAYPNANKFMSSLKDAAYRSVPTTEQMMDPEFILENAGFGGLSTKLLKPMKASEAYGRIEGRPLYVTQADRTKVGKKFLGGPGFSSLQLEDPEYAEALAAWAVQNPSIASTIINGSRQAGEHDPVFTTFIGAPDQHRSNQMVFDYIYNDFKKASKKSDLFTPEKLDLMNERLANYYKDRSTKENLFPENINILDKNLKNYANTFDKRAAIAEVIGGKGIGGKKGQIIDYDKLLRSTSDPSFLDVPSGSLGNRLFTLNGEFLENRHDLHPAFPTILQGEDLGLVYQPVPRELVMKDFHNKIRQEKGREPGYFDWALGYPPSQLITEDLLTEMQRAGYAKGGEVSMDDLHFNDDDALRMYHQEMDRMGDKISNTGASKKTGKGTARVNYSTLTKGDIGKENALHTLMANYGVDIGDLNLDAGLIKPMEADGLYIGDLTGSLPLGEGCASLGVQGMHSKYDDGLSGYTAGYSGKIGDGNLSARYFEPADHSSAGRQVQLEYAMPFAKGGEVKDLHNKYEESDYGYGNRPDKTKKGLGYFGELERPDGTGVMTEYSIGVPIHGEEMDVPTLIPTLTPDEIRLILHMQDGEDMPRSIVHKAIDHAHQRLSEGKPIFATEEDLYAHGGIVDVLHNDAIEQIMKAFMDSMEDDEPAVSIQITTQSQPLKSGKIPTSIREAKHG